MEIPVQIYSRLVSAPCLSLPQNLIHHFLVTGNPIHGEDIEPQQRQHSQSGPYIPAPVTSQRHHSVGLIRQTSSSKARAHDRQVYFGATASKKPLEYRYSPISITRRYRGQQWCISVRFSCMHASNSSSFPADLLKDVFTITVRMWWMRSAPSGQAVGISRGFIRDPDIFSPHHF